jgi:hypothetical protein
LISCTTSQSDAEDVQPMDKNIAGLLGTRFSLATMEAPCFDLNCPCQRSGTIRGLQAIPSRSGRTEMAVMIADHLPNSVRACSRGRSRKVCQFGQNGRRPQKLCRRDTATTGNFSDDIG